MSPPACAQEIKTDEHPLEIAATIHPVADIVRQIGGELVHVTILISQGANPHTFEFAPDVIKKVEHTQLIFRVGFGYDDWLEGVYDFAPAAKIITAGEGVELIKTGTVDPHYWLSVSNARTIAQNVAAHLVQIDSKHQTEYENRLKQYLEILNQLDLELHAQLDSFKGNRMVTIHDAFRYFARDYGLTILDSLEPSHGGELSPNHLANLSKSVKQAEIDALFTQRNFLPQSAATFAQDLNLKMYELDELGGGEGRESFVELLRYNASVIKKALNESMKN